MARGESKIAKVIGEFREGKLRSSSGQKVTKRSQAVAIGLSEARRAGADIPKKSKGFESSVRVQVPTKSDTVEILSSNSLIVGTSGAEENVSQRMSGGKVMGASTLDI